MIAATSDPFGLLGLAAVVTAVGIMLWRVLTVLNAKDRLMTEMSNRNDERMERKDSLFADALAKHDDRMERLVDRQILEFSNHFSHVGKNLEAVERGMGAMADRLEKVEENCGGGK